MSAGCFNLVGLLLDLTGGLMLAIDLWRPHEPLEAPAEQGTILPELVAALLKDDEAERKLVLKDLHSACSALAMHTVAQASRQAPRVRLVTALGRIGLVGFVLGAALQLVGALLGGTP